MSTKQNVVVLHAGTKVSPFLKALIESRKVRFTVIANTLNDYSVSIAEKEKSDKDGSVGGWIGMELISLASCIIRDDLTSSPLASLFTQSKMINIIPLTPSEQFLATWFSEIRSDTKTAFEKTIEIFKTLTSYSSLPMSVYPLSYLQKKPISIKYRNQTGSPRVYQQYGFLDFKKKVQIDPNDFSSAIDEEKDFSIEGLDEKESIIPAEIEKILKDADAVIISASDYFSLALMLNYTDLRKSIKKSQGSVLTIAPVGSKFTLDEREKVLLKAFEIEPTINGFLNVMKDVSDTICIDSGDSDVASSARESGFNVIVDDLINIENKQDYLTLILKGAGIDISNFQVEIKAKEPDSSKENKSILKTEPTNIKSNVEVQVTNASNETIPDSTPEITKEEKSLKKSKKTSAKDNTEENIQQETEKTNESMNSNDKLEKSANIAKSVIKSTSDASEKSEEESKEIIQENNLTEIIEEIKESTENETLVKNQNNDIKSDESLDEEINYLKELFNSLMTTLADDKIENTFDQWIEDVRKYIKKDDSHAIQVANSLMAVIKQTSKDRVKNNAISAFLTLSEERKIQYRNILLIWIVTHLNDPDFSIQNTQYDILRKMITTEKYFELIGGLIDALIKQLLTSKDMTPSKQERGRLLVQRLAYNHKNLSKYAIRAFFELFEDEKVSHSDIWPGLSSFDARLVGIELVENYSVAKSRIISEEAKKKELGSFSSLLDEIVTAWEKGDMPKLTSLCGSISESTIRKAKRLSLAQNIKKVGTIPLEILARSLKEDPKELETLVYEMVMNDEIHARLEIVDGRLYILPIDTQDEEIKKDKLNAMITKDLLNTSSKESVEKKEEVKEDNDQSETESIAEEKKEEENSE